MSTTKQPASEQDEHTVIEQGDQTVSTATEQGEHAADVATEQGEHTVDTATEQGEHAIEPATEVAGESDGDADGDAEGLLASHLATVLTAHIPGLDSWVKFGILLLVVDFIGSVLDLIDALEVKSIIQSSLQDTNSLMHKIQTRMYQDTADYANTIKNISLIFIVYDFYIYYLFSCRKIFFKWHFMISRVLRLAASIWTLEQIQKLTPFYSPEESIFTVIVVVAQAYVCFHLFTSNRAQRAFNQPGF